MQQARKLQQGAEIEVEAGLVQQLAALEQRFPEHVDSQLLAVRLDKIRQDRSVIVDGKFNDAGAGRRYPVVFADAGLPVTTGDPEKIALAIKDSPIAELLVAALDDWANVSWALKNEDARQRILRIAQLAAPDPLRRRLRSAWLWRNREEIVRRMNAIRNNSDRFSRLPPQTLELAGNLLPAGTIEEETWLRRAQALHPRDFWLAFALANALLQSKKHIEAAAGYRTAVAINSKSTVAYNNWGVALAGQHKYAEAITRFEKATVLDPNDTKAYYNWGAALADQKKYAEACAKYQKAIALDPKYAPAYSNWGTALKAQQKYAKAIAKHETAIDLDSNYAAAYSNWGTALAAQKKYAEAIVKFQKAIQLDPSHANAYGALGSTLKAQGRFAEALASLRRFRKLLHPRHPLQGWAQRELRSCMQLLELEKKLPAALQNTKTTPAEQLQLADLCQRYLQRYAGAAKLYTTALKALPKANLVTTPHRYNAACAAVLAAAGKGKDQAKLTAADKTNLRRQALDWLRADLQARASRLQKQPSSAVALDKTLQHWQQDEDLAGVRNEKSLTALPKAEREQWQKLWSDVATLRKRAANSYSTRTLNGTLDNANRQQTHKSDLTAGQTYIIDMTSKQFDTYLYLRNAKGKLLAENDDIGGGNLNSLLLFTPTQDGTYHLIASSFRQHGRGRYEILVREFTPKASPARSNKKRNK